MSRIARRSLLKCLAAGVAAPYVITSDALGGPDRAPASERIVTGIVGLGFGWEMLAAGPDVQCVAVCDVQKPRRDAANVRIDGDNGSRGCAAYNDFREIIARDDIDAIYVATPDHWHALVTIAAARAGKHVYCQKPLTRTVTEGQAVRQAVSRYGIVFQHGTQQRSDWKMVFGCELVRNGYIGELRRVRLGSPTAGEDPRPQPVLPVPDWLDWEMWQGPAPWAPFTPNRIRSHNWYWISAYSMGYIAGWGIHHVDSALQGTGDAAEVVEVDGWGVFPTDGLYDTPTKWRINYGFDNGVTWDFRDTSQSRMGILFEGSEGWVFIWRRVVDAYPKSLLKQVIGPDEVRLYRSRSHAGNFLECVKSHRHDTAAPVEIAHKSNTICYLGAVSMELGRKLRWDAAGERFVGDEEANQMLSRAMREPWRL